MLDDQSSAALRDRLVNEVANISSAEEAADWAYRALPVKNTLTATDAGLVQLAFELRLSGLEGAAGGCQEEPLTGVDRDGGIRGPHATLPTAAPGTAPSAPQEKFQPAPAPPVDKSVLSLSEVRRYRDKAHLKFVASRPCLVCGRTPAEPHHLRFAQLRAFGRKSSDEFTVPLCRVHHREVHRSRDERAWWRRFGVDALKIAGALWQKTRLGHTSGTSRAEMAGPSADTGTEGQSETSPAPKLAAPTEA